MPANINAQIFFCKSSKLRTRERGIMSFTDADLLKKPGFIGYYARFLTLAKKDGKAEDN
jgi:hypothetical protein